MAIDSRQKGARGEATVCRKLKALTDYDWERTPLSGALDAKHLLKGDVYIPDVNNVFCVEVKFYAEDHLSSTILGNKTNKIREWWLQTIREASQVHKEPLLIYLWSYSKHIYVATAREPAHVSTYIKVSLNGTGSFYIMMLEDWIMGENPVWAT